MELRKFIIPRGWTLSKVGSCCEIRDQLRKPINFSERKSIQGGFPYYGPTGIVDHINHYSLDGKFALIGEDGDHFLKYRQWSMTQLVDGRINVNNHAHIISGTEQCTTEWFYRFFQHRSLMQYLSRQGAGRFKLTKAALSDLPILLPPKVEQQQIHDILLAWDIAITLTEQIIAAKQNRKQALMQQLLTGKRRFKEFEGQDWRQAHLGEFFREYSERNKDGDNLTILSCSTIHGIVPQTRIFNKRVASKNIERYKIVAKGDLVYDPMLLWDGSIGILESAERGVVSPAYCTFKFNENSGSLDYFRHLIKTHYLLEHYKIISQGTNKRRKKAPAEAFLKLTLPVPSSQAEQQKISDVLRCADTEIDLLIKKLAALKQQKQGLMQQLLTGRVRVKTG